MRVLIFGGSGMLGHKFWQTLSRNQETFVTVRRKYDAYAKWGLFDREHTVIGVSAEETDSLVRALEIVHPDVVINCVGIVKQSGLANDPIPSIAVNALFPHRLAQLCLGKGIRLVHISTDCVFSGRKGNYAESDISDAEDLYGRTKFLGEVDYPGCLTIRTSMIGREIETTNGLVEWFLGEKGGAVRGYARAIFTGLTTIALSEVITMIIERHRDLHGVWHVAADSISKFDLLMLINQVYRLGIKIEQDESVRVDRSLNGERFRSATGFVALNWRAMIEQMHNDPTPYTQLRRQCADR